MPIATRVFQLLLPTLPAVLLALTFSADACAAGRANGSQTAVPRNSELQISVQVVRGCAVDTTLANTATGLGREELVLATQALLAATCSAIQTQVAVIDVQLNLVEPLGNAPRLDVEF